LNPLPLILYLLKLFVFLLRQVERINPVKVYSNFKEDRLQIIKDHKNKAGVYCLVNLINGHIYIGSSTKLKIRMRNYLNNLFLQNKKNIKMPIVKALLKYGQNKFAVLIVEYVDVTNLAIRETNFITKLLPYYNVLKQGYSSIGFKHTKAIKEML
jgi:group I intron endonuclease